MESQINTDNLDDLSRALSIATHVMRKANHGDKKCLKLIQEALPSIEWKQQQEED